MRSEILSSNFDLLNLGAARRSIFGGSGTSSSSSRRRNTERNIDNSITSNSQNRRQTKRSQSQESPAEQQGKPSLKTLSRKRPLGQRLREPMASTTASSSSFFSRPSHQRAASSRTRSAAAAAAAATIESPLDLGLDEAGGSVASSAGVKRKRPSLPRTRGSSGVSSRAVSYRTAKEPASVSAPLSHDSTSSLRSISGSEDSSGSHISRRTSKSSLSLRRELRALAIESHSATSSPTRPRQARGTSSGRDASLSPETLADTTVVDRRRLSRQPSSSKPRNDEHAEYDEDVSSDAEDEESRANEDYLLLTLAPATQLERLRKDRLVALARQAGVPSDGLTRAQLIETLIGQRDPRRRYESSRAASGSFKNRRQASGMSKRSVSSQSADYTDESDESQGDEAGHEGGGEETEAEGLAGTAASRKRKPLRQPRLEDVFAGLSSSAKSAGSGRKIKGVRPSRVISPQRATGNYRTDEDPQTSATPLVNRLRNARSMQFAASSPARARTRMRGPMAGVKRAAPALPDPSPVKNKLRKMKLGRLCPCCASSAQDQAKACKDCGSTESAGRFGRRGYDRWA
ncbi:hypothetical protein BCV69DRAFT_8537 [Microstroma glucosiphilum]|uniref:Uncharacterized protein n=1 Tax=Pseudomicrostroma glucosiphilum TaxID=1684307 RepID=A0A316UIG1_9BASI|nr:hypothetical protein BCV69DRAFT_8537 [Pseudomicrostroma glucosiphilum]PWN23733.1 hypothetical protein BCV69DRAFT_8537 [Pseudomicrostroma glucosiphilum]